jgi:molybdenum cofactor biosynthesis enzyme MoaA
MKSKKGTLPIHTVIIKVTNECNLNCTYCFVESSVPHKANLWAGLCLLMAVYFMFREKI